MATPPQEPPPEDLTPQFKFPGFDKCSLFPLIASDARRGLEWRPDESCEPPSEFAMKSNNSRGCYYTAGDQAAKSSGAPERGGGGLPSSALQIEAPGAGLGAPGPFFIMYTTHRISRMLLTHSSSALGHRPKQRPSHFRQNHPL